MAYDCRVVDLARFIKPPNPGNPPIFRSSLVPSVAECFLRCVGEQICNLENAISLPPLVFAGKETTTWIFF